ncbi:gamma-glutamylcyclotransferase [Halorarum halophilum]|uniref:Gamma-glutamylcyclotransferase n=1 Tax=Halorarum halophilum TaxID=2743090 RepID=A0A7D5KHG4_9EURY|nr:gamma-glutamylcyclotransferase family protein [Halobaculum halophilum]QLG29136.1 gamma-glutamylcyclotransferase [Halobaculum halophilum]
MDVFVYGTLTNPETVRTIVDSLVFVGPAVLEGLRVLDGEYPTLAPPDGDGDERGNMAGPTVAGRLLRTDEVDALDAYEGVETGLYVRVTVPVVDEGSVGTRRRPTDDTNEVGGRSTAGRSGDAVNDGSGTSREASPIEEAAVYVGDPGRLGASADWPGEGAFRDRVRTALAEHSVRIRTLPSG